MATSNELIEELVTLTQGSLRNVENEVAELRADIRVLSERVNNRHNNFQRLEKKQDELEDRITDLEKAQSKYLGAASVAGAVLGFLASMAKGLLGL